jgi:hypothetical protein
MIVLGTDLLYVAPRAQASKQKSTNGITSTEKLLYRKGIKTG